MLSNTERENKKERCQLQLKYQNQSTKMERIIQTVNIWINIFSKILFRFLWGWWGWRLADAWSYSWWNQSSFQVEKQIKEIRFRWVTRLFDDTGEGFITVTRFRVILKEIDDEFTEDELDEIISEVNTFIKSF